MGAAGLVQLLKEILGSHPSPVPDNVVPITPKDLILGYINSNSDKCFNASSISARIMGVTTERAFDLLEQLFDDGEIQRFSYRRDDPVWELFNPYLNISYASLQADQGFCMCGVWETRGHKPVEPRIRQA